MNNRRHYWADIIRIVAIYMVLAGHSSDLNFSGNINDLINLIPFAIFKTGVPLFIMLSGALLLNKKEEYLFFYNKRVKRYILPWLFWSMVTAIFYTFNGSFLNSTFFEIFKTAFLSYWFLPMLSCLYLLTPLIRKFLDHIRYQDLAFLLIIWFLSVSLLPFTINSPAFPLFIDNSLLTQTVRFSGYYLMGYFLTKFKVWEKFSTMLLVTLISTGIIYILLSTRHNPSGELYFNYHSPGVILESTAGFALLIKSVQSHIKLLSGYIYKIILSMSGASFGIYLSHLIVRDWILTSSGFPIKIKYLNITAPFLNGVILFFASYVVIYLIKKINILNKLAG